MAGKASTDRSKKIVIDVGTVNGKKKAWFPETRMMASGSTGSDVTLAPIPREITNGRKWAAWGNNDRLPTDIRCKFEKIGIAGRVQYDMAKQLCGSGLVYFRKSDLQKDPKEIKRAYIPAVEEFLESNLVETEWLFPQAIDYRYNSNTFSELITSKAKDLISEIHHKEAEFCRIEKQNENTLLFDHIYYSPDFSLGYTPVESRYVKIPLIPIFRKDAYMEHMKSHNVTWHTRLKTPGILYYARQHWLGLIRDRGWMDNSIAVPEIVNAMMKNQVILKYQILIPESYFEIRYQDWMTYTDIERNNIIDTFIEELNDLLTDTENMYKSITTVFRQDAMGAELGKVEIVPIDDKLKTDNWVPGSEAANMEITIALGGHPSMLGLSADGKVMSSGSGSDKREVFNIEIDTNTIEQKKLLEPLNYIARYNAKKYRADWDIVFFIDHVRHTTTNNQEDGKVHSGFLPELES